MKKKIIVLSAILSILSGAAFLSRSALSWQSRTFNIGMDQGPAAIPTSSAGILSTMNGLPLQFIENRGQADPRARYILRGSGQTVYLTDNGLLFDFLRFESEAPPKSREALEPQKARRLVVGLDLVGSSPHPQLAASDPRAARYHYLIGNDRSKWVTDVPAYGEVLYRDVYPAVDLRVYGDGGLVRYDFIVRPGGRVADIRLAVRGADKLRLDGGRLVADTAFGELAQSEPVVFQEGPAGREPVAGRFAFADNDEYGFAVGAFDVSRPLVIDPAVLTLGYSTFLGGGGEDIAYDVKLDVDQYYVTGKTNSAGFPVTAGAYDTVIGNTDAFVAKINPGASGAASLVWCTFIGGSGADIANGIDVYGGQAYIVGTTYSSDFPLANAGSMTFNDGADAFVTQLAANGASLTHSACIGAPALDPGDRYETGNDISVFMNHAIWICGSTTYGPSFYYNTSGSHVEHGTLTSPLTSGDAYMLQVNFSDAATASPGVSMVFGGQYWDEAFSIAQDGSRIYLTGYTESSNYPVSAGAFQSSHQGGVSDAFVFKTDFGGSLTYSTYLGSSDADMGTGIDIGAGGAYVCGYSWGDLPVTANGYDTSRTHGLGVSGFLARVNEGGGSLDYATYIETEYSEQNVYAYGIATGSLGRYDCWVTGSASSYMQGTLGATSKNYYQQFQEGKDVFAARFDTSASGSDSCLFITNLGGTGWANEEVGFAIDGYLGTAVVAGSTECGDFPISASAFDASHNGGVDAFVATLIEPALAVTTHAATNVYSSSATLNSTLTSKSGAATVSLRFEFGTTSGGPYVYDGTVNISNDVPHAYSWTLTGQTPGTTYYFRARVDNALYDSPAYGAELSFTTPAAAGPTVTTTAVSDIYDGGGTSGGNVTAMGSDPVTARGICWNTTGSPTTVDSHTSDGSGTGSFTSWLTGLSHGTTYHVRAYATNAIGTAYGNEVTFTTLQEPTVTTQAVTAITASSATGNGNITSLGVPNPTAHGVCWDTAGTPTTAGSHSDNGAASATGAFTSSMTGLSAFTTYYVRAYATNSVQTSYGDLVTFTTLGTVPTVTTQAVSSIGATSATGNGNITNLGVPNPTAHGVCWNTGGTPTTADSTTNLGAAGSTGAFTATISSLSAGNTYYVRAYATNSAGIAYGNQVSFSTVPPAPVATTATNMTGSSFQANWNAAASATAYRLDVATDSAFTSFVAGYNNLDVGNVLLRAVSGLASGTTYYYRVRAYNASGTSSDSNWIEVITVPGTPVALAATGITATAFQANWNAVTGAGDYYLDVALDSGFTVFVPGFHDRDIGLTAYTVTGLAPGTLYYYRVRAYNSSGTSGYSNVITVLMRPPAPVALAATAIASSSFQANWQAALGAVGYRLDVSTSSTFDTFVTGYQDLDVGDVLSRGVSGLAPNTPYYYRVSAYNANGNSVNSNVITVTTLPVHTVTFNSTAGGWLSGALTQIIDHGGDGSPVTANPDDGYHFDGWSGTGGFSSGDNPLSVTNVITDMTITAGFSNAAPLIRITAPTNGQSVWGMVTIRAEASDDMAVQSIQFYVDGAAPMASPAHSAHASRQAGAARFLQSGDLVLDFTAADMLLLDGQNHLRKATFQGDFQPVINGDFALRELAVSGRNRVHLLFAEPRRLDDGQTYSWVLCDLDTGIIQGIRGDPALPANIVNAPIMQFDAAGNGYYFTVDGQGSMILVRLPIGPVSGLAAGTTTALYSVASQQLHDWLVLPDGTVLLALFQPQTAQLAYFRVGAEQGRVVRFEGGFAAALPGSGQVAGTPWFKVQGDQLLASSGAMLAMSAWPALRWENYLLPDVEIIDMALERGGTLFVSGRNPLGAAAGLWAVTTAGSQLVAPLPLPCRRLAVLGALEESAAADGPAPVALMATAAATDACNWNTLLYINGEHRLSAVANDSAGATARDEIVVRVANVVLSLDAQRFVDHGWLIKKHFIRVRLSVDNSGGAPVAKYVVYRRFNSGSEEIAKEFQPAEVQNGGCEFNEAAASGNPPTSYRAVALSADGMVIGAAVEVTI